MGSVKKYVKIPGKRFVLTKKMIEDAVENTRSNSEAARWLGVNYNTYKKWAKYYDIFEQHKNQSGKGIEKKFVYSSYDLDEILANKYKGYSSSKLKTRLINAGYMVEECSLCKWNEKRITDDKICLSLDFIDGNTDNYTYDNLRLLCPNCYFTNVGDFFGSKRFCK